MKRHQFYQLNISGYNPVIILDRSFLNAMSVHILKKSNKHQSQTDRSNFGQISTNTLFMQICLPFTQFACLLLKKSQLYSGCAKGPVGACYQLN